ncbi:VENN motif pre-toxin domain-containing protein [Acinetobacter colistiniresistens]|uniref:VENN motif pre-toxin domain-containing protein n=1 Tax=Acinetobacter colistiniresistens TaxID=280145 RepID=UPI00211BEF7C|nr:VENN motif pre-toxin domain-containing protein [Acinetobacter colistiniresistens]UUM26408.1 VENN motif pre-toxin domain-containing protein [Acinetobacter colistiniresistens]
MAHTILGAAVAATGGNNALSAGIAAGSAESAAPLLAEYLYGKKAKDLTASEKSTISSIVGLAGSAVGATTGDVSSTVQGGQSAQNAVENNYLTVKQVNSYKDEMQSCNKNRNCDQVIEKYRVLALKQDEELVAVCSTSPSACKTYYQFILTQRNQVKEAIGNATKYLPNIDPGALYLQQINAEGIVVNTEIAKQLQAKYGMDDQTAQLTAVAIVGAMGSVKGLKISKPNEQHSPNKNEINKNGYEFKQGIDLDLRGKNYSTKDTIELAFAKTGVSKNEFSVTKWGVDKNGKSFPTEYRVTSGKNRGAEVSIDLGHDGVGTPGKKNIVGHIFLDEVDFNRSKDKPKK